MTRVDREGIEGARRGPNFKSISILLKTASACGVSRLKLGDLDVRFHSQPRQAEQQPLDTEFADSSARDSAPLGEGSLPPKVQKDLMERFNEEQLVLDDPLAYENLLIDRQHGSRAERDEEA